AARQSGLGGDFLVRSSRVPQQERLPVARRELIERGPDARAVALDLDRLVGRERGLLRLGGEEREVSSLTRRAPRIVPRHVRRHDEQPPPRVIGFVYYGPSKGLLRQVPCA